jgi:sterol desaturase/sphingolipid hydroxylase (fatty acid hydroxylase superfamily)
MTGDLRYGPLTLHSAASIYLQQGSSRVLLAGIAIVLTARIAIERFTLADLLTAMILLATWPLQERLFHEYLLHLRARRLLGTTLARRISTNHQMHHRNPWRTATIFIQPRAYFAILPAVSAICLVIARDVRLALTGLAAFLFALAWYEWIHFLIHTPYVPRSMWYRRRWQNHRLHHFRNSRYWYGITSPLGDTLLGSGPEPAHVPKKWNGPAM